MDDASVGFSVPLEDGFDNRQGGFDAGDLEKSGDVSLNVSKV